MRKPGGFLYFHRCVWKLRLVEKAARNLIETIKASDLQVSSNDLGNAIDELEDALKK